MKLDVGRHFGEEGAPQRSLVVTGYSVDTRTLEPGDMYFALRGACHDGHDFVDEAIRKGAAAVVVEGIRGERPDGFARTFVVPDTLRALQSLALWARRQWGGKVVGVTGSAGKTTTKDAIAGLLATGMPVGKTMGNRNNHIGVPLSILRLPDECRVAVLEMGMNHGGEIRALAGLARPDVGVVTNVGYAHVEFFASIEEVALAKRELIEELPAEGVAVLNGDDPRVAAFRHMHPGRSVTFGFSDGADVRAEGFSAVYGESTSAGSSFEVRGVSFETAMAGRHGAMNVLAGIAVALEFGIPLADLRTAARSLAPGRMRGERTVHEGITILNDCYNSNPEAVRSMVDLLESTPARRRVAVLGEMLELGQSAEPLHREVGSYVAARGIDVLIGIRGASRQMVEEAMDAGMSGAAYFFEDPATAGDFVRQIVKPGDAVLFKGSRGVQVEKAVERLLA